MTKAIVTCNLLIRKEPGVNAVRLGYYQSGDEIEIEDAVTGLTHDDYYEGIPSWYKLTNGNYVWSGCVSMDPNEAVFLKKLSLDKEIASDGKINNASYIYSNELSLAIKLPKSEGNSIKIAVLDSGIDRSHSDLSTRIIFPKPEKAVDVTSDHGTKVVGLIVGQNDHFKGLTKSLIGDYPITSTGMNVHPDKVIRALRNIRDLNEIEIKNTDSLKYDLINLSLDIHKDYLNDAREILTQLVQQGCVPIMAGGDGDSYHKNIYTLKDKGISVGVFLFHHFEKHKKQGFLHKHHAWFLDSDIISHPNFKEDFSKCSAYTAIVTGIIARVIEDASIPREQRLAKCINFLKQASWDITKETDRYPTKLKLYK